MIFRLIRNIATKDPAINAYTVVAFLLLIWAIAGLVKTIRKDVRGSE